FRRHIRHTLQHKTCAVKIEVSEAVRADDLSGAVANDARLLNTVQPAHESCSNGVPGAAQTHTARLVRRRKQRVELLEIFVLVDFDGGSIYGVRCRRIVPPEL